MSNSTTLCKKKNRSDFEDARIQLKCPLLKHSRRKLFFLWKMSPSSLCPNSHVTQTQKKNTISLFAAIYCECTIIRTLIRKKNLFKLVLWNVLPVCDPGLNCVFYPIKVTSFMWSVVPTAEGETPQHPSHVSSLPTLISQQFNSFNSFIKEDKKRTCVVIRRDSVT